MLGIGRGGAGAMPQQPRGAPQQPGGPQTQGNLPANRLACHHTVSRLLTGHARAAHVNSCFLELWSQVHCHVYCTVSVMQDF